jgi:hypothetical protein
MKTLMQIFLVVFVILLLPFFLMLRLFGWRPQRKGTIRSLFPSKPEGFAIVSPEQSDRQPYPYVQVNNDGSARELHKSEREYLETPFFGADGARPYVKWRYTQKNGWGELGGFLKRTKLPKRVHIAPAPVEEPKQDVKGETIRRAREMGYDIIENANGSTTMVPSKMFRSDL